MSAPRNRCTNSSISVVRSPPRNRASKRIQSYSNGAHDGRPASAAYAMLNCVQTPLGGPASSLLGCFMLKGPDEAARRQSSSEKRTSNMADVPQAPPNPCHALHRRASRERRLIFRSYFCRLREIGRAEEPKGSRTAHMTDDPQAPPTLC